MHADHCRFVSLWSGLPFLFLIFSERKKEHVFFFSFCRVDVSDVFGRAKLIVLRTMKDASSAFARTPSEWTITFRCSLTFGKEVVCFSSLNRPCPWARNKEKSRKGEAAKIQMRASITGFLYWCAKHHRKRRCALLVSLVRFGWSLYTVMNNNRPSVRVD